MRLLCVSATLVGSISVTPVQKVIEMLQGMKTKGQAEKDSEEVQFAKYQQFCEDTSRLKQTAVKDGTRHIDSLQATIAKAVADSNRLSKEVAHHDKEIALFASDKDAAHKIREKENTDFKSMDLEYEESIDAIERAIEVLKSKSADTKQAKALLQEVSQLMDDKSRKVVTSFIAQDPEILELDKLDMKAPEANAWDFKSQGVVDLLRELREKFIDERVAHRKEESNNKHTYEMMVSDLAAQTEESTRQKGVKEEGRAKRLQKKGDAEGELADTTTTRDDDQKYLNDMTAICEVKAKDFKERSQLRADELVAIGQAIEILSSGAVSGSSEKHLSFLQISSRHHNLKGSFTDIQKRAAAFLKVESERIGSRILAASALKMATDPLAKVKTMIKDLITRLLEEAADESTKKGWCDTELTANKKTRESKTTSVESLHAEIDGLSSSVVVMVESISNLHKQITELDKSVVEAIKIRTADKTENEAAIKDAVEAQGAVARAVAVLERFYIEAGQATSLIQKNAQHKQQPIAPEIFDKAYTGMQSENGGVIGMLEVIQSDFARLEAETSAAEVQSANEHREFMNDSELDKVQKKKDIEHKSANLSDQKQNLIEAKGDLRGTQKELDAANSYYDSLKPQCIDSGTSVEERTQRREEEIESLREALKILSGEEI